MKMNYLKGNIFKIKRFSLHDGPGIRTSVFLKGCPLQCIWCHSPEGIDPAITVWHSSNNCIGCGLCVRSCPENALTIPDPAKNSVSINRLKCTLYWNCVTICPTGSMQYTGYEISAKEVFEIIKSDIRFYESSGGGITLTGGEPLFQPDFSANILSFCKDAGIHTAIETCLFCDQENLGKLAEYVDLFIVDLKLYDEKLHLKFTGKSNSVIIGNFLSLLNIGKKVIVRIPLIRNITDTSENIDSLLRFINDTGKEIPVEYINFNPLAGNNYKRLGMEYNIES